MTPEASTETSRRGFIAWVVGVLVLLGTLLNAVPLLGALVGKPAGGTKEEFVAVGAIASLKPGLPVSLTFTEATQDAYIHQTIVRSVWAVRKATGDVVVYSPICPHLGCQYTWDTGTSRFVCPCHTSIFDIDGKVLAGPAPRGLDTLQTKIVGGKLLVLWQQFKLTTPVKSPIA